MNSPITPGGAAAAQNPLPPVPTTKILAISHFIGTPMTPAQRAQIMPHEVHDTVNAYLAGKIDPWYFRTHGKGAGRASLARYTLCARRERDDFAGSHRRTACIARLRRNGRFVIS